MIDAECLSFRPFRFLFCRQLFQDSKGTYLCPNRCGIRQQDVERYLIAIVNLLSQYHSLTNYAFLVGDFNVFTSKLM